MAADPGAVASSRYVYGGLNPAVMTDPSGMREQFAGVRRPSVPSMQIPNDFGFGGKTYKPSVLSQPPVNPDHSVNLGSFTIAASRVLNFNPLLVFSRVLQEGTSANDSGPARQAQIHCELARLESGTDSSGDERCDTYGITNLRLSDVQSTYQSPDPLVQDLISRSRQSTPGRNGVTVTGPQNATELTRTVIIDPGAAVAVTAAFFRSMNAAIPPSVQFVRRSDGQMVSRAELILLQGSDGNVFDLARRGNSQALAQLSGVLDSQRNRQYLDVFRGQYANARSMLLR
jgi:hypothetical protein